METHLGDLSSIWHQKNMNSSRKTFLVSKCLICQQHTNLIGIMTEPITISQQKKKKKRENEQYAPFPEGTKTIMESRCGKIRSRLLLPSFLHGHSKSSAAGIGRWICGQPATPTLVSAPADERWLPCASLPFQV